MRKLLSLLMGLSMVVTAACAERIIIDRSVVIVPPGEYLRGRIVPVVGETMVKLYLGDEVDIVARKDGWAEVIGGENGTCWVSEDYLADSYTSLPVPETYKVSSNGRVRVRRTPGDTDISRWCENGDEVEVLAWATVDDTEWARLTDGWVLGEFLEVCHGEQ